MYGLNWFIPALVRSSVGSFGISEDEGTILCPRSSKKRRKTFRMVFASTAGSVYRPRWRLPPGSCELVRGPCRALAQQVLRHSHPELRREAQRLLIDPFVVPV